VATKLLWGVGKGVQAKLLWGVGKGVQEGEQRVMKVSERDRTEVFVDI
jgi:hypothetical protein